MSIVKWRMEQGERKLQGDGGRKKVHANKILWVMKKFSNAKLLFIIGLGHQLSGCGFVHLYQQNLTDQRNSIQSLFTIILLGTAEFGKLLRAIW